jgi:8-oxo-dGTP pyrophosphatase MutT (NUDIX family)
MTNEIILHLKHRLTMPLPGKDAQYRMAPSYRSSISKDKVSARAGVLILLYSGENGLCTVFTKRHDYPGAHGGQISFPGGKFESSDPSLVDTALRETEEEIGIKSTDIEVLGQLTKLYIPISEFEVYPTVGYLKTDPMFVADADEVKYLIEISIAELLDPAIRKEKPYSNGEFNGTVPYFNVRENHVWGATAMILNEFLEVYKTLK